MSAAVFFRMLPREAFGSCRQDSNARCAPSMALRNSPGPASGTLTMSAPVAGFRIMMLSAPSSFHWPFNQSPGRKRSFDRSAGIVSGIGLECPPVDFRRFGLVDGPGIGVHQPAIGDGFPRQFRERGIGHARGPEARPQADGAG